MSRFNSIHEVIKLPMLGNDDIFQHSKGRMLTWAKYVWQDLNFQTLRIAKREVFHINKKFNYIDLPKNCLEVASVNIIDHHGCIWPVFRNDKLHDDLIDISVKKDCACENSCSYHLCNTIRGYEAIQETVTVPIPGGGTQDFVLVSRLGADRQGNVYREFQYTENVFTNGTWTSVVVKTKSESLCKCEVDSNGCLCDTSENIDTVCKACGIPNSFNQFPAVVCNTPSSIPHGGNAQSPPVPGVDTWIYYCNSKLDWVGVQCGQFHRCGPANNIYNINDAGNRLIFPHNFGFDKVMVRFYYHVDLKDMMIPFMAVPTFIAGLKWWDTRWNDEKQELANIYGNEYATMKWGLFLELNKYRIAEARMILTPPVHVPSYIEPRNHIPWWETPLF